MKRSIFFIVLAFFWSGSVLADTSDTALRLLILGNQKYALEQSLGVAPVAAVVVDPSVTLSPTALFNVFEPHLVTIAPSDSALANKVAVPLVIILGTEKKAIWDLYAQVLAQAPDLIPALIKGETSMLGAMVYAESNTVEILGVHPDLLVIAGKYMLGQSSLGQSIKDSAVQPVPPVLTDSAVSSEEAKTIVQEQEAQDMEAQLQVVASDQLEQPEAAESSSGGLGFWGVLLFVAALVGTIVYMDKTVLKS